MIFPWRGGSLRGPSADILLMNLAPAVIGSDSTPRPREGFRAGRMAALLGKQAPKTRLRLQRWPPPVLRTSNYPQSGFKTDRVDLLKQNKERNEVNKAFIEGFQPICVSLVIDWKQPSQTRARGKREMWSITYTNDQKPAFTQTGRHCRQCLESRPEGSCH